MIYVITYWMGVREIIIRLRKQYPAFKDSKQRIIKQLVYSILYAIVMKWVLNFFIDGFVRTIPGFVCFYPNFVQMLSATYSVLFLMMAVYESIYFYDQLRLSIQEKERFKQEHLRSELEGLRNQVNPHFLFNSLNTLMNIIPKDSNLAVHFLQRMSKVYRYILESREEQIIPLKEELDFAHSYVFLLKERFKNKLEIEINIPQEYLNYYVLPLSLQLLLENAIKHNVVSKNKPLLIELLVQDNNLLMVRNNLQVKKQVMNSTKVGLDNIRQRYRFFTEQAIEVNQNESHFWVMIPMIPKPSTIGVHKISEHERSNKQRASEQRASEQRTSKHSTV